MTTAALPTTGFEAPFEWIVNSNALGVAFLSRQQDFRISFLSRHARLRLEDGYLLGRTPDELLGAPAGTLADIGALRVDQLRNPDNYPTTVVIPIDSHHIELAISSVMANDGSYLGAMVTFKDVTAVVRSQEESAAFAGQVGRHAETAKSAADTTEQLTDGLNRAVATVQGNGDELSRLLAQLTKLNGQTRMLSLNASIESVRAGEAGNAFRVIADEVGQLALRTQAVADEVEGILATIRQDSENAYQCATSLTESVETLVSAQRQLFDEVQRRT